MNENQLVKFKNRLLNIQTQLQGGCLACGKDTESELDGNEMRDLVEFLSGLPRWIPVSERLPEENKNVIVTDIETSDTYQSQYFGNGYWECDNGICKNRIIAWMPLPEPYKAEKGGE